MKITELFRRGEFVVTAEVGPPKGFHIEGLIEEAKEHLSGVIACSNITDSLFMALSALGAGLLLSWGWEIPQIFLLMAPTTALVGLLIKLGIKE